MQKTLINMNGVCIKFEQEVGAIIVSHLEQLEHLQAILRAIGAPWCSKCEQWIMPKDVLDCVNCEDMCSCKACEQECMTEYTYITHRTKVQLSGPLTIVHEHNFLRVCEYCRDEVLCSGCAECPCRGDCAYKRKIQNEEKGPGH